MKSARDGHHLVTNWGQIPKSSFYRGDNRAPARLTREQRSPALRAVADEPADRGSRKTTSERRDR